MIEGTDYGLGRMCTGAAVYFNSLYLLSCFRAHFVVVHYGLAHMLVGLAR